MNRSVWYELFTVTDRKWMGKVHLMSCSSTLDVWQTTVPAKY